MNNWHTIMTAAACYGHVITFFDFYCQFLTGKVNAEAGRKSHMQPGANHLMTSTGIAVVSQYVHKMSHFMTAALSNRVTSHNYFDNQGLSEL